MSSKNSGQDDSTTAEPPAKKIRYNQGQVKGTEKLYLQPKFADVHFLFVSDDGKTMSTVSAHKNLLAVNSDVFEKMFYGALKESGNYVTITDVTDGVFKEFLQFFYMSEVELTAKNVACILYLGDKYDVQKCVNGCVKILIDGLTNENVCNTLALAILYDQKQLKMVCEKRIMLNTDVVFKSAGFCECDKMVLEHILKMNALSCSEVDVFEACMSWVRVQSQQNALTKPMVERYFGDLYYEIRFASMSIQEICTLESKYKAVLAGDFNIIVRIISQSEVEPHKFNIFPREIKWNAAAIIECKRENFNATHGWYALNAEEKTIFSTNEMLLLGNFRCNKIMFGEGSRRSLKSHLTVNVEIYEARTLEDSNGKVVTKLKANLQSDYTTVSLPQPIVIRPGFFYTICIKGFPKRHWFNSFEQHSSVSLQTGTKVEFHSEKIVDGKIVGLIWLLSFNEI